MGKKSAKKNIENSEPALSTIPEEEYEKDQDGIKTKEPSNLKSSSKVFKDSSKILKNSDNLPNEKGVPSKSILKSAKSSEKLDREKSQVSYKEYIEEDIKEVKKLGSKKVKKGKKEKEESSEAKETKDKKSKKKEKKKASTIKSNKEIQVEDSDKLNLILLEDKSTIKESKSILLSNTSVIDPEEKIKSKTSFGKDVTKSTDTLHKKTKRKKKSTEAMSHSLLDIQRTRSNKSDLSQHKSFLMLYGQTAEESSSDESEEYSLEKKEKFQKKKKDKKKKGKDEEEEKPKKEPKKKEKDKKVNEIPEIKDKKKKEGSGKSGDPEQDLLKKQLEEVKKRALGQGIVLEKELEEGPKKKISKKERAKLTAEMAEKAKQEMEAQMRRLEEMIKKKEEEARLAAIEKDRRETYEQTLRLEQLNESIYLIHDLTTIMAEKTKEENELIEWEKYVACGKLPNAAMCDQMNTYLHLWEQVLDTTSIEDASKRSQDVITLIGAVDELIDTADDEERKLTNWKWIRQLFREHQSVSLDVTTYRLLRNVEHNLNRINIPTADFNFKDDYVTLCLWLRVMLPIPLPNPRRPPKPRIDISFNMMDVSILFPIIIDCVNSAIRAMYLKYDHLSDLSETFYMPEVPKDYYMDLLEASRKEWRKNLKYKYDNRDKKIQKPLVEIPPEETENEPENPEQLTESPEKLPESEKVDDSPEPEEFDSEDEIPAVAFKQLKPTASEYAIMQEDEIYTETRTKLLIDMPENVINLRKFVILGGVYNFNLLAQPPQPQDFITMDMTLTGLYLPKKLEVLPFKVVYKPYEPPEASLPKAESVVAAIGSSRKMPEEIEDEMKKQEEALDKLIFINIKWPQHVIFLELPVVCRWDEENQLWSKEEIVDVRHNEEKCIISFRTGVFGIYGLATYRYANLPFQAYDIKPEVDGSVTVQLTAAILMLEFNVKDGLICITQLQNSPNMTMQDVIGKYFKLHKLKRMMKEVGIDIFPAFDAFCYVNGTCEKQWPMEKHLYYNMAQMANSFNFSWSRWNLQAGRRKIVLQMRQYLPEKGKQKNHQMLLVTPLKAAFVDCTEVSQTFSDKELEPLKFCADLYHLMKSTSGIFVRNKVMKASKESVYTLAQFLISTRILSFS